ILSFRTWRGSILVIGCWLARDGAFGLGPCSALPTHFYVGNHFFIVRQVWPTVPIWIRRCRDQPASVLFKITTNRESAAILEVARRVSCSTVPYRQFLPLPG